jgi:indolepyruvate ferredoxin oxidoreductase alpha subunit
VAEAAILCPSFYRADVQRNPTGWERFKAKLRTSVISFLQRRREKGRHLFARVSA